MKPILVLNLAKCSADEIVALRREGFDVPPNIWGAPSYPRQGRWALPFNLTPQ